jgi:UDP-N-acetylmuramyl pentapeptide phosphotransferase/UDP-N-acetylglucosamine-1-phosphate transferase
MENILLIVALFFSSFILSLLLTKVMIRISFSLGLLGRDVHKPNQPFVPRIGGLAVVITYLAFSGVALLIFKSGFAASFLIAPAIAAVIGFIEDLRELNPLLKPILLLLPGLPVVLLGMYEPRPVLPFIGQVRITILYPLLVLAAYTVVTNAVNSLDVINGSLVLTSTPPLLMLAGISAINGRIDSSVVAIILIAAMLGFLRYNWFPARAFSGNAGSNLVGAVIAGIAISSRLEVAAIIALIPHIMNEFYVLVSMRGLKSGKQLRSRPVALSGNLISSTMSPGAALTIVRMLAADRPRSEVEIAIYMAVISAYASILAVLTQILSQVI